MLILPTKSRNPLREAYFIITFLSTVSHLTIVCNIVKNDAMTWKRFMVTRHFVRVICRSPVDSPRKKGSNTKLWFLGFWPEQPIEQTMELPAIWGVTMSRGALCWHGLTLISACMNNHMLSGMKWLIHSQTSTVAPLGAQGIIIVLFKGYSCMFRWFTSSSNSRFNFTKN